MCVCSNTHTEESFRRLRAPLSMMRKEAVSIFFIPGVSWPLGRARELAGRLAQREGEEEEEAPYVGALCACVCVFARA